MHAKNEPRVTQIVRVIRTSLLHYGAECMIVVITYYRGCEHRLEKRNNSFQKQDAVSGERRVSRRDSAVNEAKLIVEETFDRKQ